MTESFGLEFFIFVSLVVFSQKKTPKSSILAENSMKKLAKFSDNLD